MQRKKKAYQSLKPNAPDYTVKLTAAAQAVDKGEKTLQVRSAPKNNLQCLQVFLHAHPRQLIIRSECIHIFFGGVMMRVHLSLLQHRREDLERMTEVLKGEMAKVRACPVTISIILSVGYMVCSHPTSFYHLHQSTY